MATFIYQLRVRSFLHLIRSFRFLSLMVALCGVPMLSAAKPTAEGGAAISGFANGFQLNRYQPTAAGEFSFMVDHPWFKPSKYFATGLSFDQAIRPWVLRSGDGSSVISSALTGHFLIAGSFWNRLTIAADVPLNLVESAGSSDVGVQPAGFGVGDPRLSLLVRAYNEPYLNAGSISLGLDVWLPLHRWMKGDDATPQLGESGIRFTPKVMFGGFINIVHGQGMLWSANVGLAYRPQAKLGNGDPTSDNTMGSQLQFGAALGYANMSKKIFVGAEVRFDTQLNNIFKSGYNAMEVVVAGVRVGVNRCERWCFSVNGALSLGGLVMQHNAVGVPDARVVLGLSIERYADRPGPSAPMLAPPVQMVGAPRPQMGYVPAAPYYSTPQYPQAGYGVPYAGYRAPVPSAGYGPVPGVGYPVPMATFPPGGVNVVQQPQQMMMGPQQTVHVNVGGYPQQQPGGQYPQPDGQYPQPTDGQPQYPQQPGQPEYPQQPVVDGAPDAEQQPVQVAEDVTRWLDTTPLPHNVQLVDTDRAVLPQPMDERPSFALATDDQSPVMVAPLPPDAQPPATVQVEQQPVYGPPSPDALQVEQREETPPNVQEMIDGIVTA